MRIKKLGAHRISFRRLGGKDSFSRLQTLNLNQFQCLERLRGCVPGFEILAGNPGARVGFFAVLVRWSAHVSFEVSQPRATRAGCAMRALGARGHVPQRDGTDFLELRRIAPDVDKPGAPHVAAGQRKLDAGIDISVRGDVASRVARAARAACPRHLRRRPVAARKIPRRFRLAFRPGKLPARQPCPRSIREWTCPRPSWA